MTARYDSILDAVGRTPVVRINKLAPPHVRLYVKIEAFNPMGSVKDRLALGIIEDAERRGALRPGQTVIEATSGNTGIGLAMVCAQKGYPLVVTMAENFSVERRKMMRFLGAKVVLTPAALKGSGMLAKAVELAERHGWFLCRQFENEANAEVHSRTTAPEILETFAGEPLDYWVTGYGTGGTLKGVARVLREKQPGHARSSCASRTTPRCSAAAFRSRARRRRTERQPSRRSVRILMQGWGPDFIPKLTEDAVAMQADRSHRADQRRRCLALVARAGAEGRHLRRHHGRRHACRSARGLQVCAGGLDGAVHAARHRGALPEHAAVRRHSRGHD